MGISQVVLELPGKDFVKLKDMEEFDFFEPKGSVSDEEYCPFLYFNGSLELDGQKYKYFFDQSRNYRYEGIGEQFNVFRGNFRHEFPLNSLYPERRGDIEESVESEKLKGDLRKALLYTYGLTVANTVFVGNDKRFLDHANLSNFYRNVFYKSHRGMSFPKTSLEVMLFMEGLGKCYDGFNIDRVVLKSNETNMGMKVYDKLRSLSSLNK